MLSKETKEKLFKVSNDRFNEFVSEVTDNNILYKIWNAYCDCRGNENDMLFDFKNKSDLKSWTNVVGSVYFTEFQYGIIEVDYAAYKVIAKYISTSELSEMVKKEFASIYQFVLIEPWCFQSEIVSIVFHPIIKEIGIVNPLDVGFDKEVINDELLK